VPASRSGRLSIHLGCIYNDTRVGLAEQRMLGVLGTYADSESGWCHPSYPALAQRLGIKRAAVGKAITSLARYGYLEIHERFHPETGARLSSAYRLVHDYQLPAEFDRAAGAADDDTPLATVSSYPPPETPPLATDRSRGTPLTVATLATHSSDLKRLTRTTNPDGTVATQPGPPPPDRQNDAVPRLPLDLPPRAVPKPEPPSEPAPAPVEVAPTPTNKRLARVIDLIRAAGLVYTRSDRDGAALRECDADPDEIAACYLDIAHGRWPTDGDTFPLRGLAIHTVCRSWINGWRQRGVAPTKRGGRGYDGSRHGGLSEDQRADLARNTRF
jgi:biotin operon repressor